MGTPRRRNRSVYKGPGANLSGLERSVSAREKPLLSVLKSKSAFLRVYSFEKEKYRAGVGLCRERRISIQRSMRRSLPPGIYQALSKA